MQTQPHITFRHLDRSPAVESQVREHVMQLERFNERITGCNVVVDRPAAKHRGHTPYLVSIELELPGGVINASNKQVAGAQHSDVYLAVRDAFDNATRQLQAFRRV